MFVLSCIKIHPPLQALTKGFASTRVFSHYCHHHRPHTVKSNGPECYTPGKLFISPAPELPNTIFPIVQFHLHLDPHTIYTCVQ